MVNIIKTYPKKGPLSLYRLEKIIAYKCIRCKNEKKTKLVATFNKQWDIKICNGCYGELLSIHKDYQTIIIEEIKNK